MKTFTLMTLIFFTLFGYAQKENNIWYFGSKVGLDFNGGTPTILSNSQMHSLEGCSSICNTSGQLLCYSNGERIWNRDHKVMPNGNNLFGSISSSQSSIFIPKPGSSTVYYLFTVIGAYPKGLRYSEVDITLDGGLGDITQNKNILLYTPVCEKICAIKNTADNSYWVITHGFESNAFITYKVDSNGINTSPIVSNVGSVVESYGVSNLESIGYLKMTSDGSKLVCVNSFKNVELFDFNLTTGIVSNPLTLNTLTNWSCYGAEFSPSGNILYLTAIQDNSMICSTILQYDLTAANIPNSETIIYEHPFGTFGGLQLGPDCKIYCNTYKQLNLNVIDNPDILGINCNFQQSIQLPRRNNFGLPQFVQNSYCKSRVIINDDICLGNTTTFNLGGTDSVLAATWRFGDGSTSNNIIGTHQYTAAGTYIVSGDFTTPTGNFSISKQITVPENPVAHPIQDITLCGVATADYNLTQLNPIVLGNQSSNIYGVSYFASLADASSHSNILTPIQTYNSGATTVYAKVYRLSNFDCYSVTSFKIFLLDYPLIAPVTNLKVCDDGLQNDGWASFDLNVKTDEILNGQSSNLFKVSYHESLVEAQNNLNPILTAFTNTSNPQTIFARMASLPTEACFRTTSFELVVEPSPEFELQSKYTLCEPSQNTIEISIPNIFQSYLWSTSSQNNSTTITTPGNYWLSVGQPQGNLLCSRTKNFEVVPSNTAIIKEIITEDWSDYENSIQVILDSASLGDYEYSLDGIHYQDAPIFQHLIPRKYTLHVRDKNGCGIASEEVFLLMYPKFFTPNNDGYNDQWNIRFSEIEPNLSVKIFDRYGKLLHQGTQWDGKLDGKTLPADDYWFIVSRENGKDYKGHFSLKR